ncbi:MAG: tetratricopeptide repeat protein [Microscillaceae bacterium]|nr:tetratricopeptide repeat protein [Microscillaceae bacterium]
MNKLFRIELVFWTLFFVLAITLSLSVSAQSAEDFFRLGNQAFGQHQYALARADYQKAVEKDPSFSKAYHNLGSVQYLLQEYEAALESFNRAITMAPQDAEPFASRGALYFALKKYREALADLSKAIHLHPGMAAAHYTRGLVYEGLGQIDKACEDWRQAASLSHPQACMKIEKYCGTRNTAPEARNEATLGAAMMQNPLTADDFLKRGEQKMELRNYQGAILDFEAALKINRQLAKAYFGKGTAYFAMSDPETACQDWHQALELGYKPAAEMIEHGCPR